MSKRKITQHYKEKRYNERSIKVKWTKNFH